MGRNLKNMVTVIAGASSGIGRALALDLAARGSRLVLGARRLDRLLAIGREIDRDIVALRTDVSRPEDCERLLAATLEKYGRIDTLVCSAGFGFTRGLDEMSEEEIRQIFETNLFGTIDCCRRAITIMKRQEPRDGYRGQLMIVSSACARRGLPYFSIYAATKAAQLSLAEGLRVELKPFDIAVTSVHPVLCDTDFFNTADCLSGMSPAALAAGSKQTPARVASAMVRAIEHPRREVWPKPFSRLSLTIAVMIPAVVDKVMCGISSRLVKDHQARGNLDRSQSAPPAPQRRVAPAKEAHSVS